MESRRKTGIAGGRREEYGLDGNLWRNGTVCRRAGRKQELAGQSQTGITGRTLFSESGERYLRTENGIATNWSLSGGFGRHAVALRCAPPHTPCPSETSVRA